MTKNLIAVFITAAVAFAFAANGGGQLTGAGGLTRVVTNDSRFGGSGTTTAPLTLDIAGTAGRVIGTGSGGARFDLATTAVSAGTFTNTTLTVDAFGRLTAASSGTSGVPTARQILAGTGLSGGGDLSADRTLSLANTAVSPGTYTNTTITVDAQGRITSASTGASSPNASGKGDGSDGSPVLDGVNTFTYASLSGSTYTLTRNVFWASPTLNSGIILKPDGWAMYWNGNFTNNGDVHTNGNNGSGINDGALAVSGTRFLQVSLSIGTSSTSAPQVFPASSASNAGSPGSGAGGAGHDATNGTVGRGGGGGGEGVNSTNTAGGNFGGASPSITQALQQNGDIRTREYALNTLNRQSTPYTLGTSGAQGGNASVTGGGRGTAGGWMVLIGYSVSGSGTWRAIGGNGGNGVAGTGGVQGGGGGGAGSGGLCVVELAIGTLTCNVTGGTGGTGGTATGGGGAGGRGGNGGNGYQLNL